MKLKWNHAPALPPDPGSSVPLLPSSLSSPLAEEPSLTTLFKKHPSLICFITLFYLCTDPLIGFVYFCLASTPTLLSIPATTESVVRKHKPCSHYSLLCPSYTTHRKCSLQKKGDKLPLSESCSSCHIIRHHNSLWDESQTIFLY